MGGGKRKDGIPLSINSIDVFRDGYLILFPYLDKTSSHPISTTHTYTTPHFSYTNILLFLRITILKLFLQNKRSTIQDSSDWLAPLICVNTHTQNYHKNFIAYIINSTTFCTCNITFVLIEFIPSVGNSDTVYQMNRHTHMYVRIIRCNSHKMLPQKNIWLVWYFSLEDIWAMTVWCKWYSMEEHIMKLMRRNNFTFTYLTLIRLSCAQILILLRNLIFLVCSSPWLFNLLFNLSFLFPSTIALISHTILPNQRLHLIFLCFF